MRHFNRSLLTFALTVLPVSAAFAQNAIPAQPVQGQTMQGQPMPGQAMQTQAMPGMPMTPVRMGSALMNGRIPASGMVDVTGARVFFKAEGRGRPMLLIHGYPLSGELFKNNRAALVAAGYQVITVDLPGFGRSTLQGNEASIEFYARSILGTMDALGLKSAVVGGMSMGGMTLLQMYRMSPERFTGLVFIDTTADRPGPPRPPAGAATPSRRSRWASRASCPASCPAC